MANVKVRSGVVRNAVGAILAGKSTVLKNHDTGATIGSPGTTDPNGRYTFANLPEEVRYQVEVAFGGGSSQMHVNAPISPDLDHAYVNYSLRTAPAATVAFGGAVSIIGALSAPSLALTGALTALSVSASTMYAAEMSVSGALMADTGTFQSLGVSGVTDLDLLTVHDGATFEGNLAAANGTVEALNLQANGSLSVAGSASLDSNVQIAGGAIQIDAGGTITQYSGTATFQGGTAVTLLDTPLVLWSTLPASAASERVLFEVDATGQLVIRPLDGTGGYGLPWMTFQRNNAAPTYVVVNSNLEINGTVAIDSAVLMEQSLIVQNGFLQGGTLGFFGAAGQTKPNVTGPKGGNAALTSLCAALATLGLITNSTS